ncbi:hypothetical protein ACSXCO_14990 (plasmid) [Clostridium perfringens]
MIRDLIPKVSSGELIGDKPTFPTNATVKGDFLYVRSDFLYVRSEVDLLMMEIE